MLTRILQVKHYITLKFVTHSPILSTMPAPSLPGVYGNKGLITWPPVRMRVSTGFTPADLTRISNYKKSP